MANRILGETRLASRLAADLLIALVVCFSNSSSVVSCISLSFFVRTLVLHFFFFNYPVHVVIYVGLVGLAYR